MQHFFLRLYTATRVEMAERSESGFVTAEHLALAVIGIMLVGAAMTFFMGQDGNGGFMGKLFAKIEAFGD